MDEEDERIDKYKAKIIQYLGGDHENMFVDWTKMKKEIIGEEYVEKACNEFNEGEAKYGEEDPYEGTVDVGEPYCWKWFDKLG